MEISRLLFGKCGASPQRFFVVMITENYNVGAKQIRLGKGGKVNKNLRARELLFKSVLFFLSALLVLFVFRVCFFFSFHPADTDYSLKDLLSATAMGLRVDAKWLCVFLIPAWVCVGLSFWREFFIKVAVFLSFIGLFLVCLFNCINFGFYSFYSSPINPIIFGFLQDDTKAIMHTLSADWPIFEYLFFLALGVVFPFLVCKLFPLRHFNEKGSKKKLIVLFCLLTLLFGVMVRGSLGKFPLRQEDYAVSSSSFLNSCVPNGLAAFYEANKARKALTLPSNPAQYLKEVGFKDEEQATKFLDSKIKANPVKAPSKAQNVVFIVMESMGRDVFVSHTESNNTLGSLKEELEHGYLFINGVSIQNGTFPSLEGLIFDTALSPISQSPYGRKKLSFSQILKFKDKGYKTIFLTGAPESWRQINETFHFYGFDKILGAATISNKYPEAEVGPWGIGDEWLFKYAEILVEQAEREHTPIFLMILSTSNHPPHHVPDGREVKPVAFDALPSWLKTQNKPEEVIPQLNTYQYASNQLGHFVSFLRIHGFLDNTIVAVTGDHNSRIRTEVNQNWHHVYGVPVIFWVPTSIRPNCVDHAEWVSHRDIFPTLEALALGVKTSSYLGRNIFDTDKFKYALSYNPVERYGFGISKNGLIALNDDENTDCYSWHGDLLKRMNDCPKEMREASRVLRTQRALSNFKITSELKNNEK